MPWIFCNVPQPGHDAPPPDVGTLYRALRRMQEQVWALTQTMFSSKVITPGTTRTSDLVWWWRQRVSDLGLETWFQPSVTVQRKGATAEDLGPDPVIQPGDLLHCDVGITVADLDRH